MKPPRTFTVILLLLFALSSGMEAQSRNRRSLADASAGLSLLITSMDTTAFPSITLKVKLLQGQQAVRDTGFTDIQLTENGIDQDARILCEIRPFAAAMVLDKSLSMAFYPNSRDVDPDSARWNNAKAALHMFIDQILPIDRLALVSFAQNPTTENALTSDKVILHDKLEGIKLTTGTGIWKAVDRTIDLLQSITDTRAIVLLTDGEDNASGFITMTSVANRARSLGIRVYTIGLGEDVSRNLLQDLATLTNGKFFFSATGADLVSIYQEISSDLVDGCTVTYVSGNHCTDGSVRHIELVGHYRGDVAMRDTSYTAPLDIPTVQLAFPELAPLSSGASFRVPIMVSDTLNDIEPLKFTAEIRYPAADLQFEQLITARHVLEGVRVDVTDEGGVLTLAADTSLITRPGLVLCELQFKVRERESAGVASLKWESVELLRFCAMNTVTADMDFALDGYCEPLLARDGNRLLRSNYPNPFRGVTSVPVDITDERAGAHCEITVLDALGIEVARLFSGTLPAGRHNIVWKSGDIPAGIYSIQLVADGRRERRHAVVLR